MNLKDQLIQINKLFDNGSIRSMAELEGLELFIKYKQLENPNISKRQLVLEVAKRIAQRHPFNHGNKRTALKYAEINLKEKIPEWIYEILDF